MPPFLQGNFNGNLRYEDGKLLLVYTDDMKNCNGRNDRKTTITFTCHYNKTGNDGPRFLSSQSTECSYFFEWPTSLACVPFELVRISCWIRVMIRWSFHYAIVMLVIKVTIWLNISDYCIDWLSCPKTDIMRCIVFFVHYSCYLRSIIPEISFL